MNARRTTEDAANSPAVPTHRTASTVPAILDTPVMDLPVQVGPLHAVSFETGHIVQLFAVLNLKRSISVRNRSIFSAD